VVLDLLLAPADGSDRTCSPHTDPVVTIACRVTHTASSSTQHSAAPAAGDATASASAAPGAQQPPAAGARTAAASSGSGSGCAGSDKVVFVLASPGAAAALPRQMRAEGCCVQLHGTERELLVAWRDWLQAQDPDGLVVFQVWCAGGGGGGGAVARGVL
jgi:hypothetical protein